MLTSKVAMYEQQNPAVSANQLVEEYATLVKRIAHHMLGRLPASVQLNDLIQSGMVGLLEAARKYDETKGASFETYAGIRIRGAMLDDIRKEDWAPRSVHRNARRVTEAIRAVEARTGRDAQDQEVAAEMGIELSEYHSYLHDSISTRLFSFEEIVGGDDNSAESIYGLSTGSPAAGVEDQAFRTSLADAIGTLPERERLVLALYYKEELNLKEIGAILNVSESRVSQIHSQAALRLRARLTEWQEN